MFIVVESWCLYRAGWNSDVNWTSCSSWFIFKVINYLCSWNVNLIFYCRFPTSENGSFDDAYINGEIVGILMKHKKFEDPRLPEYMIKWGQIMGFGQF